MPSSTVVGLSSTCFGSTAYHLAVLAARAHHANAVEVACSTGGPLRDLEQVIPRLDLAGLDRLSLRAGHFEAGAELETETILARLAVPVVVRADCVRDRYAWRSCENRLLIANPTHAGRPHALGELLDELFDALPEAGFCLDASAAFAAGGHPLLTALARRYADRLAQINVGSEYASSPSADSTPGDVDLVHAVLSAADLSAPIVVERSADTAWSRKLSQDVVALREIARNPRSRVDGAEPGLPSNSTRN
ncbi:hypothetical protein ACIA8G_09360 [Lentzea sp. NPDC051213]|uniref:hypothetical protein n=1 Tax=Lentzea sp. NPDC051213 TaxID=3364126 RepID=UPI0037BBC925